MNLRQGVFQCYCLLTNLVVLNQKGMTVDKDTKKQGGTTGFSTNDGAFRTWTLNALYAAALRKCL